jgi:uncharacterized protein YjhX (UPF0386 family)
MKDLMFFCSKVKQKSLHALGAGNEINAERKEKLLKIKHSNN